MQDLYANKIYTNKPDRGVKLMPVILLFGLVFLSALIFLVMTTDSFSFLERPYLLPWVIVTGLVIAAPGLVLYYRGEFNFFHPLVFAAWAYFFPAFVIGGLIVAFGLNEPYFLAYVQDQEYNLPLTMLVVILGFGGLSLGFVIPYTRKLSFKIGGYLPEWNAKIDNYLFPGVILLIVGFFNTIFGYVVGVLGFQKFQSIGTYDGLIYLTTQIWLEASFLLWMVIFKRNKFDFYSGMIGAALGLSALAKVIFAGNRGGLLSIFILVSCAYILSGRVIKFKQGVFMSITLVVFLIVGMIYGTTFRKVKGSMSNVGIEEYTGYIFDTFTEIGTKDNSEALEQGVSSLTERLDIVSSLAVVVANYEQLRPYEEGYGLDNNIYKDSVTFFIPRFIWRDKPVASEPHKYGELYFDYSENAFAVTPMGDLIRNYGLPGVFLGMVLLGIVIRFLYEVLYVMGQNSIYKKTLYFMIVLGISYEGFYGTIIPYMFKIGFTSIIGLLIVYVSMNKQKRVV